MKQRITVLFLALVMVLLTGCSPVVALDENGRITVDGVSLEEYADRFTVPEGEKQEVKTEQDDAKDPSADDGSAQKARGGIPWIDSEIKSNITEDLKTDPRDDFHLYANKEWLLENEIPEGYSDYSHYDARSLDVKKQCMELLKDESMEGHDAELIRTYNKLILDWDTRDKLGVSETEDTYNRLCRIENIDDVNDLYEEKEMVSELYTFFNFEVYPGLNDPEHNVIWVGTPILLLNDSAEYNDRTEYGNMYYDFRKEIFVYMANRLGMSEDDAGRCFDGAIAFEAKLAENIYTTAEEKQSDYMEKINNEMTFDDLTDHCKIFPAGRILSILGYNYDGVYLVARPDYFDHLDELYTNENIEGIKACLIVNYLLKFPACLDRDAYDHAHEIQNKIFGISGTIPDDEMAYDTVVKALPASMQKVYISKYGSEEDRQKMEDLCKMVIDNYREMLSENDWASDEVKENAIKKLDNITIHAAYPDKFRDTSKIDLNNCSLIEANHRLNEYNLEYYKSILGKKIDKEMWSDDMSILSCNAFYNPLQNTINMLIGMMGEPFYSSDMSTEELYASIGAFWVGHEVSHAFDSNGSQYDENGNFRNWWPDEDRNEFNRRVKKLDDYLDGIVAFGDEHFKGSNIDTEMIADMTGLQCALRMASKVEGFDYEKFFEKYAQMNVSLGVYSYELSVLRQDEHPLNYSRTNVPVQQFEEFYETFDVKEGDNMYLAPMDRLQIW